MKKSLEFSKLFFVLYGGEVIIFYWKFKDVG